MGSVDGVNEVVLDFLRHYGCRQFNVLNGNVDFVFYTLVFLVKCLFVIINKLDKVGFVVFRQRQNSLCLTRNGVAHVAAMP